MLGAPNTSSDSYDGTAPDRNSAWMRRIVSATWGGGEVVSAATGASMGTA